MKLRKPLFPLKRGLSFMEGERDGIFVCAFAQAGRVPDPDRAGGGDRPGRHCDTGKPAGLFRLFGESGAALSDRNAAGTAGNHLCQSGGIRRFCRLSGSHVPADGGSGTADGPSDRTGTQGGSGLPGRLRGRKSRVCIHSPGHEPFFSGGRAAVHPHLLSGRYLFRLDTGPDFVYHEQRASGRRDPARPEKTGQSHYGSAAGDAVHQLPGPFHPGDRALSHPVCQCHQRFSGAYLRGLRHVLPAAGRTGIAAAGCHVPGGQAVGGADGGICAGFPLPSPRGSHGADADLRFPRHDHLLYHFQSV